jgi:hypothetical protein
MRRSGTVIGLVALTLSGCGSSTRNAPLPLGRSLDATPAPTNASPAPAGDPPGEQSGTIPPEQAAKTSPPSASSAGPSPQGALRRYAFAYTNWYASSLPAHERALASLGVGAARLADQQTAASQSRAKELAADHVHNQGVVLAIAAGTGPAHGQWVIVTLEQTTGTGPYAGLPASPHVILARTVRVGPRWAVSEWNPRT